MEHIFHQPQFGENWFTYPTLYTELAKDAPNRSTIVEVGSWKGKSAAFMAVTIANLRKQIDFYCVDTWEGSPEHNEDEYIVGGTLYDLFLKNIEPVSEYIKPIRKTSVDASKDFEDNSLFAVFIDAQHEYEPVKEDIQHWLPKVKSGGILCGHDYHPSWKGVMDAVDEVLGAENIVPRIRENCWVYFKK